MLVGDAALITVFLAHRNPLPRWAGLQRRGQNFSIPGARHDRADFSFPGLSMHFWSWHLHFPDVKPKEAHSRGSEMAADGGMDALEAEVRNMLRLFIGPSESTLHPSPS